MVKKGEDIEVLRGELQKRMGVPVHVNIEEIRKPEIDAQLIADNIAQQLEKRIMFRRAMKRAIQNAMRLGAQGIKIMSAGRLNGIEIARSEWYREGRVPLHTLRADVDYGTSEAQTTYGAIGIKVWVFKGEVMGRSEQPVSSIAPTDQVPESDVEQNKKRPAAKSTSKKPKASADVKTVEKAVRKTSKTKIKEVAEKLTEKAEEGNTTASKRKAGSKKTTKKTTKKTEKPVKTTVKSTAAKAAKSAVTKSTTKKTVKKPGAKDATAS